MNLTRRTIYRQRVLQLHKHLALVETSSHQRISESKGTERTKRPNTYLPSPVDPDNTAKHQPNRCIWISRLSPQVTWSDCTEHIINQAPSLYEITPTTKPWWWRCQALWNKQITDGVGIDSATVTAPYDLRWWQNVVKDAYTTTVMVSEVVQSMFRDIGTIKATDNSLFRGSADQHFILLEAQEDLRRTY